MSNLKKIRNRLFKILFHGNRCFCMYCGKSYRKFMHEGVRAEVFRRYRVAGGGYKKNVKCPHCGSTDRIRLLYLFFELRTDAYRRKIKLLHISPNPQLAGVLRSHANIDYVCGALDTGAFEGLEPIELDVTKIGLEDNLFDIVVCNHVIEHVADDASAMREIYRVLKPKGFAILQVPLAIDLPKTIEDKSIATRKQRKIAFGQTDHVRLYGMDYFDKLKATGFRVVMDNPFKNDWPVDPDKYRLDPNEDVIICYKN